MVKYVETKNFINKTIDDNVLNRFQGQNAVTGETLKNIQTNLNNDIKRFGASTAPDDILVAQALKEVRSNLLDLIRRSNPQNAAELKAKLEAESKAKAEADLKLKQANDLKLKQAADLKALEAAKKS